MIYIAKDDQNITLGWIFFSSVEPISYIVTLYVVDYFNAAL